ncbi:hypothetical protein J6590_044406 [Homalodisca vitripennis]|nr:hypothetical protein J6590_044406 [Homalodisca vitripennis]
MRANKRGLLAKTKVINLLAHKTISQVMTYSNIHSEAKRNRKQSTLIASFGKLHAKSTVSGGVADEVIYEEEEEYDYDSYEYDDEEEPSPKATVKRTTILSESDGERNSTATDISTPSRTRRDVSSQSVPQRDESTTEPLEDPTEGDYKTTASYNRRQLNSYRSPEYQEQRRVPEAVRPVRLRHRGQHGNLLLEDVELLLPQSSTREFVTENSRTPREQHCRMLAAHFVGDTSHYNANLHPHYRGK